MNDTHMRYGRSACRSVVAGGSEFTVVEQPACAGA